MNDIATKLPAMTDDALATLRANAERLENSGTPPQRTAAAALLPAIRAEVAARVVARPPRAKPAKPRVKAAPKAVKAVKAAKSAKATLDA